MQWRKDILFKNCSTTTGYPCANTKSIPKILQKLSVMNLNVKCKIMKLLEDNIRETPDGLLFGNFLCITSKVQYMKSEFKIWTSLKFKISFLRHSL